MKLIRFGEPNRERPGLLLPDGRRIDAAALGADYDEAFFGSGGLERLARWLGREGAAAPVVADGVRLGPPLCRPRDRKSTRLNSSHGYISYAVFCLKKKKITEPFSKPRRVCLSTQRTHHTGGSPD